MTMPAFHCLELPLYRKCHGDVKIRLPTLLHTRRLTVSVLLSLKLFLKGDRHLKNISIMSLVVL